MKKILILLLLTLSSCVNNNSSSSSVIFSNSQYNSSSSFINTSSSQYNSSSTIIQNWEELGFKDIYELGFKVEFDSTFNDEIIINKKERNEIYNPEQGRYVEATIDNYYYIYDSLISEEHLKKEQKEINTFKLESSQDFQDIWLENVYKLNYVDNQLVKNNMEEISFDKTQNSITLNLQKDNNCVGYYFEVKSAYIVKDIRGFMYYIGAMVLF